MLKTICIVGSSSGIGFELTKIYLEDGCRVISCSRDATNSSALLELQEKFVHNLVMVNMDVASTYSVQSAITEMFSYSQKIDLFIFNAGVYESMRVEDWKIESFEEMVQINYLGAVRFTHALIPYLKKQKSSRLVYNISISSYFGLPYASAYSAPKAALLNFCESIKPEFELFDSKVQVINHGFVKTRLTEKNDFEMPGLIEANEAAKIIIEELQNSDKFEIKFPFGLVSFLYLLKTLPYKIAFYFTKKALR